MKVLNKIAKQFEQSPNEKGREEMYCDIAQEPQRGSNISMSWTLKEDYDFYFVK